MKRYPRRPVVLCVGGHDPCGGAGIVADVEAVHAAGAFAVTVLSAVTEQDTCGVDAIRPRPAEEVVRQCRRLLQDAKPRVLKIGLAASPDIIRALTVFAEDRPELTLVLDPVLRSGAGQSMADPETLEALRCSLIPRSTLVTPNLPEARALADAEAPADCANALLAAGAEWVLVTGTHDPVRAVANRLYNADGLQQLLEWPRLPGEFHGSGCTLASAIAGRLALGMGIPEAVAEAEAYTWDSLDQAFRTGRCQLTPNRLARLSGRTP